MTYNQRTHWFFPSWQRAFRANWFRDRGCVLPLETRLDSEWLQAVERAASDLMFHLHCAKTDEIYRHACAVVALGRNISSQDMTNDQLDLVECLFRLLADPTDLEAIMDWQNPDRMARRRVIGGIERLAPEAYVAAVSSNIYGTREWRNLETPQLRNLCKKLYRTAANKGQRRIQSVAHARKPNRELEPF